jgi:hypothetical protein
MSIQYGNQINHFWTLHGYEITPLLEKYGKDNEEPDRVPPWNKEHSLHCG